MQENEIFQRRTMFDDTREIMLSDTFEFTHQEFEKMSFSEKILAVYNQKYMDINMHKYSHYAGWLMYLFFSSTNLYIWHNHVTPLLVDRFSWSDNALYGLRVLGFYAIYITTAHWLCVLLCDSFWQPDRDDHPELFVKTLWEDHDEALKSLQPARVVDPAQKQPKTGRLRMIDYVPDENTGLRWRYCIICRNDAPPRAHHCVICNKCVLKRDHHCFMTGRCIGHGNQRYFYFLCLTVALFSFVCFFAELYYLSATNAASVRNWLRDLFVPLSVYRWLWTGDVSSLELLIIVNLFVFGLTFGMTFSFVCMQTIIITGGITTQELRHKVTIRDSSSWCQRWRDVMGEWWLLNLVMPSQILFQPTADGHHWPGLIDTGTLGQLKTVSVLP